MSHYAFVDGKCVINAVDLSTHVVEVETAGETDTVVDGPCMGHTVVKELPTIKRGRLRVRLKQDFASNLVHQTLQPLWTNKTAHTVLVRPTSAAISATNPDMTAAGAYLVGYQPVKGSFGDVPEVDAVWANVDLVEDITP